MQPFCAGRTAGPVEPAVPPQQPPKDMVWSSNSIKVPALSGDMVFTPPFLCPSLYYLFSHPRQPLSKTLGRLKMSFLYLAKVSTRMRTHLISRPPKSLFLQFGRTPLLFHNPGSSAGNRMTSYGQTNRWWTREHTQHHSHRFR